MVAIRTRFAVTLAILLVVNLVDVVYRYPTRIECSGMCVGWHLENEDAKREAVMLAN